MALKDAVAKNFFGRKDVMASILDFLFHDAISKVSADQLRDVNEAYYTIVQQPDGSFKTDNNFRDKLFEYDDGKEVISVGLELQSRREKCMVQRIMIYDGKRLYQLAKENKIYPIMNIVLDFDKNRRRPPTRLSEMVPLKDSKAKDYSFDYGYVYINIYDIAEKFDMFSCDELHDVLYLFKMENDGKLFEDALNKGKLKGRLSRDAALVCAVFLKLNIQIDDNAEETDMCEAVKQLKREAFNDGHARGRKQGMRQGIKEGEAKGIKKGEMNAVKRIVTTMLNEGLDIPFVCKTTGTSRKYVREIAMSLLRHDED